MSDKLSDKFDQYLLTLQSVADRLNKIVRNARALVRRQRELDLSVEEKVVLFSV